MSLFSQWEAGRAAKRAALRNYELARQQQIAMVHERREAAERMARLDGKTFKCGPWRWRTVLHVGTATVFRGQVHPTFKLKAERIET